MNSLEIWREEARLKHQNGTSKKILPIIEMIKLFLQISYIFRDVMILIIKEC